MLNLLVLPVADFGCMISAIALGVVAANSGSWQRVSDERTLVFRTPWTQTAFGIMSAAMCTTGFQLLVLRTPNAPPLFLAWIMSTALGGVGLLLLWMCSPLELRIDLREETYRSKHLWLTFRREALSRPLADFSGVCVLQGTLLLVFRHQRGLLYGWTLGRFPNDLRAQKQARQFSEDTGLPIVDVPWRENVRGSL